MHIFPFSKRSVFGNRETEREKVRTPKETLHGDPSYTTHGFYYRDDVKRWILLLAYLVALFI